MVRHISIFFLKEEYKSTRMEYCLEQLRKMEQSLDHTAGYRVGADCMKRPPAGIPGVPEFGDLVQVIDFPEERFACIYAEHPAHIALTQAIGTYLEKVVAVDFRI